MNLEELDRHGVEQGDEKADLRDLTNVQEESLRCWKMTEESALE